MQFEKDKKLKEYEDKYQKSLMILDQIMVENKQLQEQNN